MILTLKGKIALFRGSKNGKMNDIATELEILLIDQVINYYEKAKDLVVKDIHNNCEFEYICQIMLLIHELKIDEFLESKSFYKDFINDHKQWVKANLKYFEKVNEAKDEDKKKWAALTMIDYSRLESLRKHERTIDEWDRYMAF